MPCRSSIRLVNRVRWRRRFLFASSALLLLWKLLLVVMTLCLSAATPSLRTSHPRSSALVLLRLMFRTTLTLATPLCYGTTLALLFRVFRTTLTLATPLCYDLGHPPVLRDHLGPADPFGPALLGV